MSSGEASTPCPHLPMVCDCRAYAFETLCGNAPFTVDLFHHLSRTGCSRAAEAQQKVCDVNNRRTCSPPSNRIIWQHVALAASYLTHVVGVRAQSALLITEEDHVEIGKPVKAAAENELLHMNLSGE